MDRLISLTVRTVGADDWKNAFNLLCATHAELADAHDYTSFTSTTYDEDVAPTPTCDNISHEDLFHDSNTVTKFIKVLRENGASYDSIDGIINGLNDMGVLLRERVPRDNGDDSAQFGS